MSDYKSEYQQSLDDPGAYWLDKAQDVHWYTRPTVGVNTSNAPFNTWFDDGLINACYNAIDRHVDAGLGDRLALIHESPITDSTTTFTYAQLQDKVARFAGLLVSEGAVAGDRVLIYMPMVPEATIAVLACARIGAIHSVVFGGFAAKELAVRIDDSTPKIIVSASCGIEPNRIVEYKPLLDEALRLANHKVPSCIVLQRDACIAALTPERDLDWMAAVAHASPVDCVPLKSTDPLYILYTSGTTGNPKGVVRDIGGSVVALKWTMKAIYDVNPGDVFWAASDIGWVVGHSYIIYGPLFHGCTSILFEGKPVGTPDAAAYWRVIEKHHVKVLFTAPTAFRAIKKEDPEGSLIGNHDLSSLDALYLAGERCDTDTLFWAQNKLNVPVIDHWWQTETGYTICGNPRGIEFLPVVPGSPTVAVPGYDVQVLDPEGAPVLNGDIGAIVVRQPLPPGTFTTLWNAPERYISAYFERYPGFYETGDAGYIDDNGYVFVMARTDDVINVAGHRLSTGAMEEALASHPDVAECAVMGVNDELKGQLPVGMVILSAGCDRPVAEIEKELIARVRSEIGPVAAFRSVAVVTRLPKTRSGKILRGTMASIANSAQWNMPATIEDPTVLDDIAETLKALGYATDTDSSRTGE